jgi:hypothetical protein
MNAALFGSRWNLVSNAIASERTNNPKLDSLYHTRETSQLYDPLIQEASCLQARGRFLPDRGGAGELRGGRSWCALWKRHEFGGGEKRSEQVYSVLPDSGKYEIYATLTLKAETVTLYAASLRRAI